MDRHIGGRVAASNPLGKLAGTDGLWFEEGAEAIVDVFEDAIGDEGLELFVVWIGELVVNDFGEDTGPGSEIDKFIKLIKMKNRGLFDQGVLSCEE
jgi:hypothetical protein